MPQNIIPDYITGNSFIELARRNCGLLSKGTFKDILPLITGFIDIYPLKNPSAIYPPIDCPPTNCPPIDCPPICHPIQSSKKLSCNWWIENNVKQNNKRYMCVRWREFDETGKERKPTRSVRRHHEEKIQKMWNEKVPLNEVLDYIEYCRKT